MRQVKQKIDTFPFIILAIFMGNFLAQVNSGTVNVAVPSIMKDLGANINSVQWIITGFMLAVGTISPVVGYLGSRVGYKKLYVFALLGLTFFSALCGLAWNMGFLIIFRILQGICAGIIQISTLSMIYQFIEKKKQPIAISFWTISIMAAPALGPTLGGLLTYYFGWKVLFFANVPIGIFSILCAIWFLPEGKELKVVSLDSWGLVTVVAGNVSLLMYFSMGPDLGWVSVPSLGLLLLGVLGIGAFIWRETTVKEPLLNLSVFKNRKFALGTMVSCLLTIGMFSSVFLIPLLMEEAHGATPFTVGLVMLPGALIMILVTLIVGKLQDQVDPAWFVFAGALLVSMATWEFGRLEMDSSTGHIVFWLIIRYIGVGLALSPVTAISMSEIPKELTGHASSISGWLRQAISALSIAIFSSILTIRKEAHLSEFSIGEVRQATEQMAFLLASNETFQAATLAMVFSIPVSLFLLKRKEKEIMISTVQRKAN